MPLYPFRCPECGSMFAELQPVDERTDTLPCGQCDTEAKRLFGVGVTSTDFFYRDRDKGIEKNMQSYKALTRQGYNPPSIFTAHEIEAKAKTRAEIAWGHSFNHDQSRELAQEVRGETD